MTSRAERITERARRVLAAPPDSALTAEAERHAQACRWIKYHTYPSNAPVGDPDIGDPVLANLVHGSHLLAGDELRTGFNHLIVAATGTAPVVTARTDGQFACAGMDLDGAAFRTGPHADLDGAVTAVASWRYPCDRCGAVKRTPAALLPVPRPPHLVVFGLCAGCVWTVEQTYPNCYLIPRGSTS